MQLPNRRSLCIKNLGFRSKNSYHALRLDHGRELLHQWVAQKTNKYIDISKRHRYDVLHFRTLFVELLWIAPELLPLTITPGSAATQKGDVFSFAIILEEIVVRGGPYEVARTFMTAQEVRSVSLLSFNSNFSTISLSLRCLCCEDREQGISIGKSSLEAGSRAEGLSAGHTVVDGEVLARNSRRTAQFPHHSRHNTRNHEVLLFQIQLTTMANGRFIRRSFYIFYIFYIFYRF